MSHDQELTIEERFARLERRCDDLEVENAALRRAVASPGQAVAVPVAVPAPQTDPDPGSTDDADAPSEFDRRKLLRNGLAAAGAAMAGAVLLDAAPAAAADGSTLLLGTQGQVCTQPTGFSVTGTSASYGLGVIDNSFLAGTTIQKPAILAHARNADFTYALHAVGQGAAGIRVDSTTVGVDVQTGTYAKGINVAADRGPGVYAATTDTVFNALTAGVQGVGSDNAHGVYGVTDGHGYGVIGQTFGDGVAVYGLADSAIGVEGECDTGIGVKGTATTGKGVRGTAEGGRGVDGVATTGTGVYGTSTSGNGVLGASTNGVAIVGLSTNSVGVQASSTNGFALYTSASNAVAAYLSGAQGAMRLVALPGRGAPTADAYAHALGDVVEDKDGNAWICVVAGADASTHKWRKLAGPNAAGSFHVLPAPARIYDSRAGSQPPQGPKTKLSGNVARAVDCTVNSSGVPVGATAVALTVLLVNAANANGNMTVWANGAARPVSNTMVWGAGSGRYTTSTISAIDAAAKLQVSASAATDLVLDVVGYYR